ncbi:MAG: hypothetical protein L0229_15740 [Blastocatellia bacterium]|nr:hypothetical protein [Blastocatellia bacterium]
MPLPGGSADKFGNRYEGRWTVRCLVKVLDERADSIRLEPPGIEGEGVEFWLRRGETREYHQVKRQHGDGGRWTLADLSRNGVLSHIWKKLNDETSRYIFVSTHDAHQLDELSDRARRASSWEEFEREFLKAKELSSNFNLLRQCWNKCPPEVAYEILKRVEVEALKENTLLDLIENRLEVLVKGDSSSVIDVLAQLALDKIHHELTAYDIWRHLESRGYHRHQWGKDRHVLASVEAANDLYLSPIHNEFIAERMIPRDEVQSALQIFDSPDGKNNVLLVGEAGVGKSNVISQLVEALQKRGWPILAFRVDRLHQTQLPDNVGEQIGLPASPANVLAAIAQGRDCVLVIDQLDAISLASGRQTHLFYCINKIIEQAQAHSCLHLLLACRKFDLDNDQRLRRLIGEHGVAVPVTINRLSHAVVQGVVTNIGLDAGRLNTKQLDLLSVPLHLKLLAEVAEDSSIDALDFETANDLYDLFWNRKQEVIRQRLGRPVRWALVLDALCDFMSDEQVLYAPKTVVDEYGEDATAMESEYVLIRDDQKYAFFHEGFFDYAFARSFVARRRQFITFLEDDEQHLFRRAQVRQILLHEREANRARYLSDLNALLTQPNIRFHLKATVFALLKSVSDPTEEEWNIIAPLITDSDNPLTRQVWRVLHDSIPWFLLLDSLSLIEQWLADPKEERVDRAVMLLADVQKRVPDRVAELIEPYVGQKEPWPNRLLYLMERSSLSSGRRFFDLFLRLIDEGVLDEITRGVGINNDFWSLLYSLPKERLEWCCEVIGHYFNRRLALSVAAGQPNPFDRQSGTIPDSQIGNQIFMPSAQRAPDSFVDHILPFILSVIESTARREGNLPWHDPVWAYRSGDHSYRIEEALLAAMEAALSHLAANKPDVFAAIANRLRGLNYETVQYLLIRAYVATGAVFADEVAEYLCTLPISYSEDTHWATRELLKVITPHCSNEHLQMLEDVILSRYTEWEKTAGGRRARGYHQFVLLDGIDPSRLSKGATKRLAEWRRKFGDRPIKAPATKNGEIDWGYVGPPVPESAADKMTDKQWLSAIARYNRGDEHPIRDGQLVGGAMELSRLLESQVKKQPERFAELLFKFPDGTNLYYFYAVLNGISEADVDANTVLRVCERCHQIPNHPPGMEICRAIAKMDEHPIPEKAVNILSWYATEDPNPQKETWRTTANNSGYHRDDILTAAINSVRGTAAKAIGDLIFKSVNNASLFLPTLEQIATDSSIAVRSCGAIALTALLNYDRDLAVSLFKQLCDTEDVLLKTQTIENFLRYALYTHFETLAPILERMIASDLPEVATAGTRQVCLASLNLKEAQPLARLCLSGTDAQRIGVAQVFAANLHLERFRSFCAKELVHLFNDPNDEVRSKAANCFNRFEGEQLGEYTELIEAFVQSPTFTTGFSGLIRALEKATSKLPDVTYLICKRFLDLSGPDAADFRTRAFVNSDKISQLLIRLYSQCTSETLQAQCLDLIDRMTQIGIYGLDRALMLKDRI